MFSISCVSSDLWDKSGTPERQSPLKQISRIDLNNAKCEPSIWDGFDFSPLTFYRLRMAADKEILANRQAYHEFHILDKFEAGAVLVGTEVKSIMEGRIQLKDSYVAVKDGEVWLMNAHISPYSHGNKQNHDPLRTRKLLLHRKEIEKLERETTVKGMTLVVTSIYWKNGRIKFEIGTAKGKKLYDKRETEMRKTIEKETRQQLKEKDR